MYMYYVDGFGKRNLGCDKEATYLSYLGYLIKLGYAPPADGGLDEKDLQITPTHHQHNGMHDSTKLIGMLVSNLKHTMISERWRREGKRILELS